MTKRYLLSALCKSTVSVVLTLAINDDHLNLNIRLFIFQILIFKTLTMSLLSPTEMFDLVVRGVLVNALGCLGIAFNIMIIIVLRKPEFTKVSLNLIVLCKFTDRD